MKDGGAGRAIRTFFERRRTAKIRVWDKTQQKKKKRGGQVKIVHVHYV